MYFNQIRRNSRRNRKENGLYFGSLVVAIVAFYVLLSLGEQDVMTFLKTMESDAVGKLLTLIPLVYVVSLFFVFFLVYFANRYQLQRRSHEFGIYQILGMKRNRLFTMLMGEMVWNSLIALLTGIPVALFLTELISLTTAKLVGLGIIGHQFRVSIPGLLGTVVGFMAVQILGMVILSFRMSRKDPIELLKGETEISQAVAPGVIGWVWFFLGVLLLLVAYGLEVFLLQSLDYLVVLAILITGIAGTFSLFRGLATFIGRWVRNRSARSTGLFAFTGRQLQENVLHQSRSLTISSLLVLIAIVCMAYGSTSAVLSNDDYLERTADFTLQGSQEDIERVLNSPQIKPYVQDYYPIVLSSFSGAIYDEEGQVVDEGRDFSWEGLTTAVEALPESSSRDSLLRELEYESLYLVSLNSFNALRESMGKQGVTLNPEEVMLYSSAQFANNYEQEFRAVLQTHPEIMLDGKPYSLVSDLQTLNFVADRFISIRYALIVPDEVYRSVIDDQEPFAWNMVLKPAFIQEQGLMQALYQVNASLANTGLEYESYLQGIGRQLFYLVAGSYITLYLGALFLIIANTVLGLKFLMQQRITRHRYETLFMLGASEEALCSSARTQIRVYFALVIGVAVISAVFGVWSMFISFIGVQSTDNMGTIVMIAGIAVIVFLLIEFCYIRLIQSESDKEIRRMNSVNSR